MAVKRSKRAAEKVPSSTKLKTLQDALSKNKRLRSQFIADPGTVLRSQGVEIGEDKERQIAGYLSDLTAPQRNAFEATNTKLTVTNLRAISPDWNISEQRIEFAGDARWNGATGELAANSAQLVSSTVAIAAKGRKKPRKAR